MVTQHQAVSKILKGQSMLCKSSLSRKAGDVSNGDNKMVVFQLRCLWPEACTGHHPLVLQVDGLDFSCVEIGFRTEAANWRDGIENSNTPRNNLRQHRLENEIVFFADQAHFNVIICFKVLLERDGGVDASKTPADDEDPRWLHLQLPPPESESAQLLTQARARPHEN